MSGLDDISAAEAEALNAHLAGYVAARRWFRGKARAVTRCTLEDTLPLQAEGARAWFAIVRVAYADGGNEDYVLPILLATPDEAGRLRAEHAHLVVASLGDGRAIVDALGDERVLRLLPRLLEREETLRAGATTLRFRRVAPDVPLGSAAPRPLNAEQSNTSIAYGDAYILKVIRKLDEGVSADLEMGEFLTRAGYTHAPAVLGALELTRDGGPPGTVGILHAFVPNRGDAWSFFGGRLEALLDQDVAPGGRLVLGEDRASVERLATRIAEMHLALGSRSDVPAFAPESITSEDRARLASAARASWRDALASLRSKAGSLPPDAASLVTELAGRDAALGGALDRFAGSATPAGKIRVHGDLHLGQVLVSGDDFVLIDFEGEPARPLAERKAKRSPLADVAGMLRSLHYAAVSAARAARADRGRSGAPERERATLTTLAWHEEARAAFLEAYFAAVRGASFLPPSDAETREMLDFYVLEKCLYEVHYEMNNRPDWVAIPLEGLAQLPWGTRAS